MRFRQGRSRSGSSKYEASSFMRTAQSGCLSPVSPFTVGSSSLVAMAISDGAGGVRVRRSSTLRTGPDLACEAHGDRLRERNPAAAARAEDLHEITLAAAPLTGLTKRSL